MAEPVHSDAGAGGAADRARPGGGQSPSALASTLDRVPPGRGAVAQAAGIGAGRLVVCSVKGPRDDGQYWTADRTGGNGSAPRRPGQLVLQAAMSGPPVPVGALSGDWTPRYPRRTRRRPP
jgi:hypothetical protein